MDPVELERELLRNFKTNEVMPIPDDNNENVSGITNYNQDD